MMLDLNLVDDEYCVEECGEELYLVCTYTFQNGPTIPGSWQGLQPHLDV